MKNNAKKNKKKVYVGLSVDILHKGHINILKKANKFGDVIVGLLTDKAIASYKKLPHLNYNQRELVLRNIRYVKRVIPQDTRSYKNNLIKIKPDFVVHEDNQWKKGIQKNVRLEIKKLLRGWSGKLIEIKSGKIFNEKEIEKNELRIGSSPQERVSKLKRLMDSKSIVRILESHNALTGLIIETLKIKRKKTFDEFDGIWSSSLADSVTRGKPDNQSVDLSTRISSLNEVLETTTKPLVFDADNGGRDEQLPYTVKNLERLGISAIVMEDKIGSKKNSLFKNQKGVKQQSIQGFSNKIRLAVKAKKSENFLVIARIESFILGKKIGDALKRAEAYSKAGVDAILIHSKSKTPDEIFDFAKKFRKSKYYKPLVCVPSTYSSTHENELIKHGFKIVIYANQLLRSAFPAMLKTAKKILIDKKSSFAEKNISGLNEILNLIK